MNTSLEGRTAIISGAAHGMGKAGVKTFLEAGATVVVADVRADEAEATAREMEAADGRVLAIQADATDPESVTSMVDQVMKTFGRIDVLWNCVGGMGWQPDGKRKAEDGRGPLDGGYDILNLEPEEWDWNIRLNLTTVYLMCRAVLPHMIAAGKGAIISMGTGGALDIHEAGIDNHHYNAAKAGLVTLSRMMARNYGRSGIRSNVIIPGTIASWPSQRIIEHAERRSALKRIGTVEEVADAALFLASDASSFITGEELRLDGGAHVWGSPGYAR